tara:strand:- start:8376 stop:8636 length:261 start_codon:yes stop_codon:yes gene_type:complete
MVSTEQILSIHNNIQALGKALNTTMDEVILLRREIESLKRIITEGVVEDNSVKSMTSRLFDSVQELQEEHGVAKLTHTLFERERLL